MATGFVKNLVGFSSESIINFIISFITVPIATRLFAPDAYGQVIMLQSVVLLCVVLPQFGQDQAFARFFHESKDKNRLLNINLTVVLVAWSFVMMGSVIFSRILFQGSQRYCHNFGGLYSASYVFDSNVPDGLPDADQNQVLHCAKRDLQYLNKGSDSVHRIPPLRLQHVCISPSRDDDGFCHSMPAGTVS